MIRADYKLVVMTEMNGSVETSVYQSNIFQIIKRETRNGVLVSEYFFNYFRNNYNGMFTSDD